MGRDSNHQELSFQKRMTTYESVNEEIKKVLDIFDKFVHMNELDGWLKSATVEDIKNSFKLTKCVEDTIHRLETQKCIDVFVNVLNSWWKVKNRTKVYDTKFFSCASDHLLTKFFTNSDINANTTDIAIRIYTSIYPTSRFESCLSQIILRSTSHESLLDFAITTKDCYNLNELECRLLLRKWSNEIDCGYLKEVKDVIENMLLNYKIEAHLSTLLGILCLENIKEQENMIKRIILEYLECKMVDRSVLCQRFWLALLQKVDKSYLANVCVRYETFFKKLLDFIVYLGCMINCEIDYIELKISIEPNRTSLCPNVDYNELLNLLNFLANFDFTLKSQIKLRITQAQNIKDCKIWQQIEKDVDFY